MLFLLYKSMTLLSLNIIYIFTVPVKKLVWFSGRKRGRPRKSESRISESLATVVETVSFSEQSKLNRDNNSIIFWAFQPQSMYNATITGDLI